MKPALCIRTAGVPCPEVDALASLALSGVARREADGAAILAPIALAPSMRLPAVVLEHWIWGEND